MITNGSPPRAWGQCIDRAHREPNPRFTPTRVGTIPSVQDLKLLNPVHPHARGDNSPSACGSRTCSGSPPRAWGQLDGSRRGQPSVRFTPTRVGTIFVRAFRISLLTVHPHARGDNHFPILRPVPRPGSPPRAWGQFLAGLGGGLYCRFTPTRVGTIPRSPGQIPRSTVHPHARGDNSIGHVVPRQYFGSPPRAWGQLCGKAVDVTDVRFTPTRVGTMWRR